MPNHVTNIIEIKDRGGVDLKEIRSFFLNEENQVDFNVITPTPECLKDFEPHMGIVGAAKAVVQAPLSGNMLIASLQLSNQMRALERYEDEDKENPFSDEERLQIERAIANYKECGFCYWYDWQNASWGTKWNAYGQPKDGYPEDTTVYRFDTAWSHPIKLIGMLSKRLPDVTFSVKFADEDTGSNCGSYEIKNGEILKEDIAPLYSDQTEDQRVKYRKFAFLTRYPNDDPRSHGYDENFEYSDEVYDAWEAEQEAA